MREWLWEPLAVAALNQSPDEASARPFVRVLADLFGPRAADSSLALPVTPLHETYALPARAFITARGGEVRTGALARAMPSGTTAWAASGVDVRGELAATAPVIAAVPWFALGALLRRLDDPADWPLIAARASRDGRRSRSSRSTSGTTAPVMDDAFVGLPGRDTAVGLRQARAPRFGEQRRASHLSLVSSGADAIAGDDGTHDTATTR